MTDDAESKKKVRHNNIVKMFVAMLLIGGSYVSDLEFFFDIPRFEPF